MNRENLRASSAGRATTAHSKNSSHCLKKEQCVVWLPEKGQYLRGISIRPFNGMPISSIDTCEQPEQAAIYEGNKATRVAEQLMQLHDIRPVLRAHYGSQQ